MLPVSTRAVRWCGLFLACMEVNLQQPEQKTSAELRGHWRDHVRAKTVQVFVSALEMPFLPHRSSKSPRNNISNMYLDDIPHLLLRYQREKKSRLCVVFQSQSTINYPLSWINKRCWEEIQEPCGEHYRSRTRTKNRGEWKISALPGFSSEPQSYGWHDITALSCAFS